jgi:starch phosphorylase
MHPPLQLFNIVPKLPPALEPLREIVYNLWWSWEPAARRLFRELDIALWEKTNHNPLRMLQLSRQARLEEVARDETFLRELARIHAQFKAYLAREDTYGKRRAKLAPAGSPVRKRDDLVAYFSAEFGFHESVPNYSGGLGILSGDHCKSASDLDLNFCAVGLLYRHGYFKQQINREGWQDAVQLNQNFYNLPVQEIRLDGGDGEPLTIAVELPGRRVFAKVWKLAVGRINLYLLDTDIPTNSAEDRAITAQLYGGDLEMRIRQEIVLGMGGPRALAALGLKPSVYHMNEGHAAFLGLERARHIVHAHKLEFRAALQIVAAGGIFTTHTPVPAGNDAFTRELISRYFGDYPAQVGIDFGYFFSLGQTSTDATDTFSMTILALRTSRHANGVSKLHGEVSKGLWKDVWTGVPEDEVPITSITNGIHTKTWAAPEFMELYDRYLGTDWEENLTNVDYWLRVNRIPDDVLWDTHQKLKARLILFTRERVRAQRERLGESPAQLRAVNNILNPEILTIGFARRFATYKRGSLLFSQSDRLLKLINDPERPVQFVFAGKAHPKDDGGKKVIQEVYKHTREAQFANRVVFIEDYDAYIGRRLYQGVDLWLNNPLRPLEASGTSGMKLPPSGGLNLSVLDGWWCEGYNGKNGWPIGAEIVDGSVEFQNEVDVESLFHILETQVIPLYYAKPDGRLPIAWLRLMRESILSVTPVYNTHRMVMEYSERLYEPAAEAYRALNANEGKQAVELSQWKNKMRRDWPQIRIRDVQLTHPDRVNIQVGDPLEVSARVDLGAIEPSEVRVQVYCGKSQENSIVQPTIIELTRVEKLEQGGSFVFRGAIPSNESGAYGFSVRVVPTHRNLTQEHELRLISWA